MIINPGNMVVGILPVPSRFGHIDQPPGMIPDVRLRLLALGLAVLIKPEILPWELYHPKLSLGTKRRNLES